MELKNVDSHADRDEREIAYGRLTETVFNGNKLTRLDLEILVSIGGCDYRYFSTLNL